MYIIVVFGGPVYSLYSHHIHVVVVFGGPQQQHTCGVSKGAKQDHQKKQ
jgi:hypothetical protein